MDDAARALSSIKEGLDRHAVDCPEQPHAIVLPADACARFGWAGATLYGVNVEASDLQPAGSFRLRCPGSAHGVEHHVALWAAEVAQRDTTDDDDVPARYAG